MYNSGDSSLPWNERPEVKAGRKIVITTDSGPNEIGEVVDFDSSLRLRSTHEDFDGVRQPFGPTYRVPETADVQRLTVEEAEGVRQGDMCGRLQGAKLFAHQIMDDEPTEPDGALRVLDIVSNQHLKYHPAPVKTENDRRSDIYDKKTPYYISLRDDEMPTYVFWRRVQDPVPTVQKSARSRSASPSPEPTSPPEEPEVYRKPARSKSRSPSKILDPKDFSHMKTMPGTWPLYFRQYLMDYGLVHALEKLAITHPVQARAMEDDVDILTLHNHDLAQVFANIVKHGTMFDVTGLNEETLPDYEDSPNERADTEVLPSSEIADTEEVSDYVPTSPKYGSDEEVSPYAPTSPRYGSDEEVSPYVPTSPNYGLDTGVLPSTEIVDAESPSINHATVRAPTERPLDFLKYYGESSNGQQIIRGKTYCFFVEYNHFDHNAEKDMIPEEYIVRQVVHHGHNEGEASNSPRHSQHLQSQMRERLLQSQNAPGPREEPSRSPFKRVPTLTEVGKLQQLVRTLQNAVLRRTQSCPVCDTVFENGIEEASQHFEEHRQEFRHYQQLLGHDIDEASESETDEEVRAEMEKPSKHPVTGRPTISHISTRQQFKSVSPGKSVSFAPDTAGVRKAQSLRSPKRVIARPSKRTRPQDVTDPVVASSSKTRQPTKRKSPRSSPKAATKWNPGSPYPETKRWAAIYGPNGLPEAPVFDPPSPSGRAKKFKRLNNNRTTPLETEEGTVEGSTQRPTSLNPLTPARRTTRSVTPSRQQPKPVPAPYGPLKIPSGTPSRISSRRVTKSPTPNRQRSKTPIAHIPLKIPSASVSRLASGSKRGSRSRSLVEAENDSESEGKIRAAKRAGKRKANDDLFTISPAEERSQLRTIKRRKIVKAIDLIYRDQDAEDGLADSEPSPKRTKAPSKIVAVKFPKLSTKEKAKSLSPPARRVTRSASPKDVMASIETSSRVQSAEPAPVPKASSTVSRSRRSATPASAPAPVRTPPKTRRSTSPMVVIPVKRAALAKSSPKKTAKPKKSKSRELQALGSPTTTGTRSGRGYSVGSAAANGNRQASKVLKSKATGKVAKDSKKKAATGKDGRKGTKKAKGRK